MAKYFIQDETLTNLADKIRILNGTEDTMTPDEMNNALTSANEEVDTQSDLIDQLSEMLEGKAVGGGSDPSYENCFVNIINNSGYPIQCIASTTVNQNGELNYYFNEAYDISEGVSCEIAKGFPISICFRSSFYPDIQDFQLNTDITLLYFAGSYACFVINNGDSHTITINESSDSGEK